MQVLMTSPDMEVYTRTQYYLCGAYNGTVLESPEEASGPRFASLSQMSNLRRPLKHPNCLK